ncbi:glycosyltransferase family 2 protein [Luteimonas sp. A611]
MLLIPVGTRAERAPLKALIGGTRKLGPGSKPVIRVEPEIPVVPALVVPEAGNGEPDGVVMVEQVSEGGRSGVDSSDEIASLQSEIIELRGHLARVEQRSAGQIELQALELSRLKAEMRTRTDMLHSRHEALLNGRIFSALRRLSGLLRWPMRAGKAVSSPQITRAVPSAHPTTGEHDRRAELQASGQGQPQVAAPGKAGSAGAGAAGAPAPQTIPPPQSVRIAGVPYMSRKKGGVVGAEVTYPGEPLISVIMTTYNTENYVEAAIRSILEQSWRNLELVVVDDSSSDSTRARVEALQRKDGRIKLYCFGENNGTYFCKNFGITKSSGSVVTFMDSDDISLPARIEKQFHALNRAGVAVSTCNHVRKNEEDGSTILINGVAERVAYISQMVKKSVIEEIGYFDTVRTSADDEFLRRVRITYGLEAQVNVKDVLYVALLRDGSLTSDPANAINFVQDRNAAQSFLSPQRRHYAAMCDKWHKHLDERGLRPYMPFPVVRRPYPVFGRLLVGEGRYDGNKITACMATYPPREDKLRIVVAALLPQVDTINIYLNGYDDVPAFLKHSRINAVVGGPDLRDNGKFHFTQDVPDGFCFTVDDDIAYPPEYVQSLIRKIEFYERNVIVGLHGTIYAKPIRSFFRGRTLLHFEEGLDTDIIVNQLGTGTVAFHTDLLRPELAWFETTGMADVWLALETRRRRIPLVAIARQAHWLLPIGTEETTLFREFRKNDDMQTDVVRQLSPWREELSRDLALSVAGKKQKLGESYARLLPMLGVGDAARRA